jgi:glutathione S-transferase
MKIVLHQYPPVPGTPSVSPFCVKVHWALHLKKLEYEIRDTLFPKRVSPSGKLPIAEIDDERIVDSTAIMRRLDALVPEPALYPSDPLLHARVHVLEDWGDETLYWTAVYYRWAVDENFARFAPHLFGKLPAMMRPMGPWVGRRAMLAQAVAQGIGRRSLGVVDAELEQHLKAIDALVGDGGLLVGKALTAADLGVAAPLVALKLGFTPEPQKAIAAHAATSKWLDRVVEACG